MGMVALATTAWLLTAPLDDPVRFALLAAIVVISTPVLVYVSESPRGPSTEWLAGVSQARDLASQAEQQIASQALSDAFADELQVALTVAQSLAALVTLVEDNATDEICDWLEDNAHYLLRLEDQTGVQISRAAIAADQVDDLSQLRAELAKLARMLLTEAERLRGDRARNPIARS